MGSPAIEVRHLVKRYPKMSSNAVDGLTFSVAESEIFGLLGPNGAGKTTTIGVLTTRVRPTEGAVLVGGVDVVREPALARSKLGVVPQRSNLDRSLSVRQNLLFHASYHGVAKEVAHIRAEELLGTFGLEDRAGQKPDFFSGGQAQRMMIARALMHAPEVLFLDEPTTGLDPAARLFVWDRIQQLKSQGVTVVITTHDMSEADELADRVAIVDHGRLLALDTPQALKRSLPSAHRATLTYELDRLSQAEPLVAKVRALPGILGVEVVSQEEPSLMESEGFVPPQLDTLNCVVSPAFGTILELKIEGENDPSVLLGALSEISSEQGTRLVRFSSAERDLEDVFIALTGRRLR